MANTETGNHRILRGGITIESLTSKGTLTAVARRRSRGRSKVLVTNAHVVRGAGPPLGGNEYIFHGGKEEDDRVGQLYKVGSKKSWTVPVPFGMPGSRNVGDFAALRLIPHGRDSFDLHVHDYDSDTMHLPAPIVQGCVPLEKDEEYSIFSRYNSNSSESTDLTVTHLEHGVRTQGFDQQEYYYADAFVLMGSRVPKEGDSGSALVKRDNDGNWRIAGIMFGGIGRVHFAYPASMAEDMLGIEFGVRAPYAFAGNSIVVRPGDAFTLYGQYSRALEPNAGPLKYHWEELGDEVPAFPASDAFSSSSSSTFTATADQNKLPDRLTRFRYKLTVMDRNGARATDIANVFVLNDPPKVNAGLNDCVTFNSQVTLKGFGWDPNADRLTVEWTQTEGPAVTLTYSGGAPFRPSFTAPNKRSTLKFELKATDPYAASATDEVIIEVHSPNGKSGWTDTGLTSGCGPNRTKEQVCLIEGSARYRFIADPETLVWEDWEDVVDAAPRNRVEGTWSDKEPKETDVQSGIRLKKQVRTVTFDQYRRSVNQCHGRLDAIGFDTERFDWSPKAIKEEQWVLDFGSAKPVTPPGTTPTAAPTMAPTVTATATGDSVTLTWASVTGAEEYVVEIGISDGLGRESLAVAATSITVRGLLSRRTYEYRVRAKNSVGEGPWTTLASIPTTGARPPQPTGGQWDFRYLNNKLEAKLTELSAADPAVTEVWVYLETGPSSDNVEAVEILDVTLNTALNTWTTVLDNSDSLWRTGTWTAKIRAFNQLGFSLVSDTKSAIAPPLTKSMVAPVNVTASTTHNSVTIRWAAVDGATGYDVQLGVIEEGEEIGYKSYSTTGLSYTVTNLKSRARYYYRVRGKNAGGAGPWSDVGSVVTSSPPRPPSRPTPDPPHQPDVTHDWTFDSYEGCGPTRKRVEACSNGHARHTRTIRDPESYRWRTLNDGSPTTTYTAWSNMGEPYLSGNSCKQVQIRQSTTVQRRKQVNHCNDGVERAADPIKTTRNQRRVITVTETWGNWRDTGHTRENSIDLLLYKEQERFSSPCNRRDTRWVVA